MGRLDEMFADLLDPGEPGESGESQATMRAAARYAVGEQVATGGEPCHGNSNSSPQFARGSPMPNRPECQYPRGFSPDSPDSPKEDEHSNSLDSGPVAHWLALVSWTDVDIEAFTTRCDRLVRWGYDETEAEAMAERLTNSARNGDDRHTCAADCCRFRGGLCSDHRRAGLSSPVVGRELASLPQRCDGFKP